VRPLGLGEARESGHLGDDEGTKLPSRTKAVAKTKKPRSTLESTLIEGIAPDRSIHHQTLG
jgi:hypothetical protein